MSQLDIERAKKALAYRLRLWGIDEPARNAREFIDALVTQGWVVQPNRETRKQPPRRDQECATHPGQWAENCGPCRTDQLAGDYEPSSTRPRPGDATAGLAACREGLRT